MDDLEKQLADAFQRKEPPPGFEARVLAAAETTKERKWLWMTPRLRWAAALAMSVVVTVGVVEYREASERAAGEAAKARLQLALKITSEKLRKIQNEVNAAGQDQ
jgi:hypothetical protein